MRVVLRMAVVLGMGCVGESGPADAPDCSDPDVCLPPSDTAETHDTDLCLPADPVRDFVDLPGDPDACADAATVDVCNARASCSAVVLAPVLADGTCGRFVYLACVAVDSTADNGCPDAPVAYEVPGRGCMTQDDWGRCPPPSLGWSDCDDGVWMHACPEGTFCPR